MKKWMYQALTKQGDDMIFRHDLSHLMVPIIEREAACEPEWIKKLKLTTNFPCASHVHYAIPEIRKWVQQMQIPWFYPIRANI